MTLQHTIERLSHFQCQDCGGWWSIGDFGAQYPPNVPPPITHLHCPWCGIRHTIEKSDEPRR